LPIVALSDTSESVGVDSRQLRRARRRKAADQLRLYSEIREIERRWQAEREAIGREIYERLVTAVYIAILPGGTKTEYFDYVVPQ
jgi:hypothetical protein